MHKLTLPQVTFNCPKCNRPYSCSFIISILPFCRPCSSEVKWHEMVNIKINLFVFEFDNKDKLWNVHSPEGTVIKERMSLPKAVEHVHS